VSALHSPNISFFRSADVIEFENDGIAFAAVDAASLNQVCQQAATIFNKIPPLILVPADIMNFAVCAIMRSRIFSLALLTIVMSRFRF
jgi:hypothetical protein